MTSGDIDITAISRQLGAAGYVTEMYGGGGVYVLRIGAHELPSDHGAQLAAGPAHWDSDRGRYMSARADFCIGPDNGTDGDDPDDFHTFPSTAAEDEITAYILAALAAPCPLCGKPSATGTCRPCGEVLHYAQPRTPRP